MIVTILLNGLWQGALVAAIGAIITALVPQRHAATRYAVWFVALLALALLPILTLWHPTPQIAELTPAVIARTTAAVQATSDNSWWLIVLWVAGVVLMLARLLRSHLRIRRIMKAALPARSLGADILTSHDVAYPIAAGLFAPMVILPANVATTLEPRDVEAIVRHERAHIARHDILTNLAQRLIEACLFFNPWAYVIGRQLLKEREAACDDWAVHATGEPDRYASCLAQLASGSQPRTPLLTPSALGSRRMLVGRIARLLNGKATQLKINYFVLGATVTLFVALTFLVQTASASADGKPDNANLNIPACSHGVQVANAVDPGISKADFRPNVESGVLVTINAAGHVVDTKIVLSSGSPAIDNDTLNAARKSTYRPQIGINCQPEASHYYFHIQTGPH